MAPVASWARSLGGARLEGDELAGYFTDDDTNQFYVPQQYHHTPTERSRTPAKSTLIKLLLYWIIPFISDTAPTTCVPLSLEHGQIFCVGGYNEGARCTYRLVP